MRRYEANADKILDLDVTRFDSVFHVHWGNWMQGQAASWEGSISPTTSGTRAAESASASRLTLFFYPKLPLLPTFFIGESGASSSTTDSADSVNYLSLPSGRVERELTCLPLCEMGRVLSVGDGIARVYGLKEIQAIKLPRTAERSNGLDRFFSSIKTIPLLWERINEEGVSCKCGASSYLLLSFVIESILGRPWSLIGGG